VQSALSSASISNCVYQSDDCDSAELARSKSNWPICSEPIIGCVETRASVIERGRGKTVPGSTAGPRTGRSNSHQHGEYIKNIDEFMNIGEWELMGDAKEVKRKK